MGAISQDKYVTQAGWADVPHIPEDWKAAQRRIQPAHILPAREFGEPVSSIGRIYPWPFEKLSVTPFPVPPSWPRLYGFDPAPNNTGALFATVDEQNDCVYCYGEYFQTHSVPRLHANAIQYRGEWLQGLCDPAAETKLIDGRRVIKVYRELGLALKHAENAVTAGLQAVTDRVITGRLKFFSFLSRLRFEWNNYRRDPKGVIIKMNDHLVDCLRYMLLGGLQYATVDPDYVNRMAVLSGPSTGGVVDTEAGF